MSDFPSGRAYAARMALYEAKATNDFVMCRDCNESMFFSDYYSHYLTEHIRPRHVQERRALAPLYYGLAESLSLIEV
jgi:hypothetical protein